MQAPTDAGPTIQDELRTYLRERFPQLTTDIRLQVYKYKVVIRVTQQSGDVVLRKDWDLRNGWAWHEQAFRENQYERITQTIERKLEQQG